MAFSAPDIDGVITQTGTDANLAGLSGITGITVTQDDGTRGITTYDMGTYRLKIDGILSHDPDKELMVFHHERSGNTDSGKPVISFGGAGEYYYGVKTTTSSGRNGYSTGCGLMILGRPYSNWHPDDAAIYIASASAKFVCRGGIIQNTRPLYLAGQVDIEETIFLNSNDRFSMEIRVFGNDTILTDRASNIVLAGGISIMNAYRMQEQKIIFRNGAISRVYGHYYEAELYDFDVSQNIFDYDIGNCANDIALIQDHHVINSKTGSDVRTMWRNTTGRENCIGNTFIHKEVSLNVVDASSNPIENVKMYLVDNPSAYAKSVSYTTTHATDIYSTPTLSVATVSNGGKTISYDYTGTIEYNKITDVNGSIPTFRILTATQFLEYELDDTAGGAVYGIINFDASNRWLDNTTGLLPTYTDWDSSSFGNYFKVDRRCNSNTNADDFTFKFCSYNHLLSKTTRNLKGTGVLSIDWLLFDDISITESDISVVGLYTGIENSKKFYDSAKAFLYNNFSGQSDAIVGRDGNDIDANGYDVVIDKTAPDTFDFDGSTITIKSDNYIGQIQNTGSLTLLNGALYNAIPTYLNLTLQDGYIAIYDNNGDLKYYTNEDQIIELPLASTGTWTYIVAKYGFRKIEGSFDINQSTINIIPRYTPDLYVSDVLENVSAYNTFSNVQEIYDYLSYYSTLTASMEYPEYYLYGDSVNLINNNLVIDPSSIEVLSYDGSTFTINSVKIESTLLFDTIRTTGNIYLSAEATFENLYVESLNVYQNSAIDLLGLNLNGTLVYNTDVNESLFYTNCTIDKVINNGTGLINITRINSIIYDVTDPEITTSVPITINITTPVDAYTAIYKPNGDRLYYGTGNQTLIIGGSDSVTGTWTYVVSRYGYVSVNGSFDMNVDLSSTTNINPSTFSVDPLITEVDRSVAASYTNLNTSYKLYDYLAYFKTTSDGIIYSTSTNNGLVSRSIGSFVFDKSLTLDSDALNVLDVDITGNIFTIKSSGLDEVLTVYVDGDFNLLNSSTLTKDVKVRADNLDSEIEFIGVDGITFYSTGQDRDTNTNAGEYIANPLIYRFKFGQTYSGVTFSGSVYIRAQISTTSILDVMDIVQYNNVLDLGTYGQLQSILNSQEIINDGVKKASRLIPHSRDI